ncbi:MAG: efflux RND transporter periplasmic adaptor subunit [Bacteroidota bacterium]
MKNSFIKSLYTVSLIAILFSCSKDPESTKVHAGSITESVYASGIVKSQNQYQVYPTANGILQDVFISEGDEIKINQALFSISNEPSRLSRENAQLLANFNDYDANATKLKDLKLNIDFAKNKMSSDSLNYVRQKSLFEQKISSKFQFEQSELAFQNSKTTYQSALIRYSDLKKQLTFSDQQAKRNLQISQKLENDFTIKSELNGRVYSILKEKGEMVNMQSPIAVIGNANDFVIELQIDENDIVKVKKGQKIIIHMDSYKDKTFEAVVTKINPFLNERSKTFTIEAVFTQKPEVLYPNLSLEANVIILTKNNTLTIPRKFLIDEHYVVKKSGEKIKVETGLIDFEKVEILKGLTKNDYLIIPVE